MKAWRVHPDELAEKNYGLVSDGYGFEDSPDCERISGGVNSKGPESVALGRQGNWFLWGFCAPPSEMTESARRAFLNAVVYMKRFDGQRAARQENRELPALGVRLRGAPRRGRGRDQDFLPEVVLPKILEATGGDRGEGQGLRQGERGLDLLGGVRAAIDEARCVPPGKKPKRIVVDEDAQVPRDPEQRSQDPRTRVEMLEKGDRKEVAVRLLERYTDQKHGSDAAAWRKWLDANRSRLYFTDTGGYRFRAKPEPAVSAARKE